MLIIKHDRPNPDSDIPLSYELLEPDRLPTNSERWIATHPMGKITVSNKDGSVSEHIVKHGIEYDEHEQIVAYHILAEHPGNELVMGRTYETRRYERNRVFHYFDPERAEQTRGMSRFVAVINILADTRDLIDFELKAALAQACFGVHFGGQPGNILNPAHGDGAGNPPKDADGNTPTQLQPGMFTTGDQAATFYQGSRPGNTFEPAIRIFQRLAGAGFGIGYSATSKDYGQGAYSALRQEDNEDERAYRQDQGLHKRHLVKRIWRDFVRVAVLKGWLGATAATEYRKDPSRFEACTIRLPGRKHINPQQEVMAEILGLANGLKELDECLNTSGTSPEDRLKKLAAAKKLAEELELTLAWAYGVSTVPANGGATAPAEEAKATDADELEEETEKNLSDGRAAPVPPVLMGGARV